MRGVCERGEIVGHGKDNLIEWEISAHAMKAPESRRCEGRSASWIDWYIPSVGGKIYNHQMVLGSIPNHREIPRCIYELRTDFVRTSWKRPLKVLSVQTHRYAFVSCL